MQKINIRNSFYLLCLQVVLTSLFCSRLSAQYQKITDNPSKKSGLPNMFDHDSKPYYFGLAFSPNLSRYRVARSDYFIENDSVLSINPIASPGFGVGLVSCLQFNRFFDLRFIPMISFSDRALNYVNKYGNYANEEQQFRVEAVLFQLPLSIKLKSDRIKNFRFYGLTGIKFDWDMNSNARSKKFDEVIRVRNTDFGYELGGGMNFYFSNFILSPELKISRGTKNLLIPDATSQLSNSLQYIKSSILQFSIFLES